MLVAGGGPAGSVLAWALARRGLRTLVLERARFPREKVCGDFVDPRGLRILEEMGCLDELERLQPPRIDRTATYVEWERHYDGPIAFYGQDATLPSHGCAIRREQLDAAMLEAAAGAGAAVHEQTAVKDVQASAAGAEVIATRGGREVRYRARAVAGADGANSAVARSVGLAVEDPRRTVVAQRAYARTGDGEAPSATEVFFDESLFPGYGWLFPAGDGTLNVGVGLLSETRRRTQSHMPALFEHFVARLRRRHPGAHDLELCSKPIGGVLRTYGAAGPNHFDGGVLVGDAGCFANPMTGDGITPGMESSLLASEALADALDDGEASTRRLAPYELAFRSRFDHSMAFLDLCAGMLRNRHMARPWLSALARGCQVAQQDQVFAHTSGSFFGGLDVRPFGILGQVWSRMLEDALLAWPRAAWMREQEETSTPGTSPRELLEWQLALGRSALSDPLWHARWSLDVQRQWAHMLASASATARDPRAEGLG